jgi:hypothetical protein
LHQFLEAKRRHFRMKAHKAYPRFRNCQNYGQQPVWLSHSSDESPERKSSHWCALPLFHHEPRKCSSEFGHTNSNAPYWPVISHPLRQPRFYIWWTAFGPGHLGAEGTKTHSGKIHSPNSSSLELGFLNSCFSPPPRHSNHAWFYDVL